MGWNTPDDKPNRVDRVPHEVIERKLLVALDDEGKVALVLSETDLLLLIEAALWLNKFPVPDQQGSNQSENDDKKDRLEDLIDGMEQLGTKAFGGD